MSLDYEKEFSSIIEGFVDENNVEKAKKDELLKTIFYSGVVTGFVASAEYGQSQMECIMQMPMFGGGELNA